MRTGWPSTRRAHLGCDRSCRTVVVLSPERVVRERSGAAAEFVASPAPHLSVGLACWP